MSGETRRDAPPRLDVGVGEALVVEHGGRSVADSDAAGRGMQVHADLHAACVGPAEDALEVVEARIDPGGVFGEVGVGVHLAEVTGDLEARERRAPPVQRLDVVLGGGALRQHAAAQRRAPLRGMKAPFGR